MTINGPKFNKVKKFSKHPWYPTPIFDYADSIIVTGCSLRRNAKSQNKDKHWAEVPYVGTPLYVGSSVTREMMARNAFILSGERN
jgi:hypothetical protein